MTYDKLRLTRIADLQDEAIRASEHYRLFLAGPYINLAEDKHHNDNTSTDAKKLRYCLNEHLENEGHTVYLGEDVIIRDNGEKHYGEYNNAVFYERHYIKDHIDAIVILPSSPGSFCEVGDWASASDICNKMIVLIDKSHENKRNYINDGVLAAASYFGAQIAYEDYQDTESIKKIINEFVDSIAASSRIEKLYGRK